MIGPTPADAAAPLRTGSSRLGRELIDSLIAAGYTAEGVCARLGIGSIFRYQALDDERAMPASIESPLDVLIHVLLAGRALPRDQAASLAGASLIGALEASGILRRDDAHPGLLAPSVLFYPAEGLYIASDLGGDPFALVERRPDSEFVQPIDSVYPAIASNTGELLALLPRDRCESFLDLCSGTAIAALVLAPHVDQAWAVDVTARATRFAEFNAELNGVTNVTMLQGDLYEPVRDRTFDCIVAHPPYVPTLGQGVIYRSGGTDGEQITRRIIEGLPAHLRRGGRFYCSCMLSDRQDGAAEDRVRAMLGAARNEFDVYLIGHAVSTPENYFARSARRSDAASDQALVDELNRLGVTRLALCTVVILRHDGERPAVTARRQAGDRTGRAEIEWLIEWETAATNPDLPARLVDRRPRLSPAVRLEVISRPAHGTWQPEQCMIRTQWPFDRVVEVPLEVAQFVSGCAGDGTIADHLTRAKAAGLAPQGMTGPEFASSLMPLIASGVLLVDASV